MGNFPKLNPAILIRDTKAILGKCKEGSFYTALVAFVLLLMILLAVATAINLKQKQEKIITAALSNPKNDMTRGTHFDKFEMLPIEARSVFVYDLNEHRIIYEKNSEAQLPLASLAKVMLAATSIGIIPDNYVVTIPTKETTDGKVVAYIPGLASGDRLIFKDLLDYTLTISSNQGASLIATIATEASGKLSATTTTFVDKMNSNAKKLGMHQTFFLNESGLDKDMETSGAYGSAKDMAILLEYMLKFHAGALEASTFDDIKVPTLGGTKRNATNTNTLIKNTPRVLASKTGLTDLAGGNLVMVIDAGLAHPVIIALLGSTEKGRFKDMNLLIHTTEDVLNMEP
jgi:D-alanyl-D-alanine carboxypeptidase